MMLIKKWIMEDEFKDLQNEKSDHKSWRGNFLVSRYNLADPNFRETVVFLVDHNEEGALGFVVNRALDLTVFDVLPELTGPRAKESQVYLGGPVQKEYIMALHNGRGIPFGTEIVPGVFFEPIFKNLFPYFVDEDADAKILTFAGYSGWGPGQLESEMDQETWIIVPGDPDLIFADNPEQSWREALRAKGGLFKVFAETTVDPDLN